MVSPLLKFVQSVTVQTALYWAAPVPNGFGGYTYSAPVEIAVRWDDVVTIFKDVGSQGPARAEQGREVMSDAQLLVNQELAVGGRVLLARLTDFLPIQLQDPVALGAREIIKVGKNPLFRSKTEFVHTAYL